MPVLELARSLVLSPDELEQVVAAYNEVRARLGFGEDDNPLTRAIAAKVISVFESGERDPATVVEKVMESFSEPLWPE